MAILQTENLTKIYGGKAVVNGVNLSVNEGDIYGFVGRNGAGKTTVIRILAGLAKKSSGSYSIFGVPCGSAELTAVRRDMRVVVESATLYPSLNARQNLTIQCKLLGADAGCIPGLLRDVELDGAGKKQVKNFSLGMRHRLQIAMAMVGEPRLLLLDEPTNGLDPEGIFRVRELLVKLNRERGVTILVSSHILSELSKFATCYGFIEDGRLIKEIPAERLNAECANRVRVKVNETELAQRLLTENNYTYTVIEGGMEVSGADSPEILRLFMGSGVSVYGLETLEGDLESYFLGLIGGVHENR